MEQRTWTPGEYPAAVTPRGIFVLEPGNEELAQCFWKLMSEGADLPKLLQELTSSFAADLASLPGFVAIIDEGGGAHVAVRGAFELVVDAPGGPRSLQSGSVITWSEHRFPTISGWRIATPLGEGSEIAVQVSPWVVESAVLPVTTLASGIVGEVDLADEEGEEQARGDALADSVPPVRKSVEDLNAHTLVEWLEPEDEGMDKWDAGDPVPVSESAARSVYDDLFGETRKQSVEEAAVRVVRDSEYVEADAAAGAASQTMAPPIDDDTDAEAFVPDEPNAEFFDDPVVSVPSPPARLEPVDTALPIPEGGFFIDSVPQAFKAQSPTSATDSPPMPTPRAVPPVPPPPSRLEGDHDGETVLPSRASVLREAAQRAEQGMGAVADTGSSITGPRRTRIVPEDGGPHVLALLCEQGHPNPTHAAACRICGAAITDRSATVERPPLGRVVLSTGEDFPLDRDVIIGRRPRYVPEEGRPDARIVVVPSPGKQISRSHCEIRVDDWDVRVRDLGSNNGTYLHRPGEAPVRLPERVPTVVKPGDVLDLGEGVSVRMEA